VHPPPACRASAGNSSCCLPLPRLLGHAPHEPPLSARVDDEEEEEEEEDEEEVLITVAIVRLILVPAAITLEPANTVDGAEGGGPLDDGDGDGDDARARARARRLKLPPPLGLPLLPASRVIDHPPPPSPPPLLLLCPCSCSHSSLLPAVGVPAVPAVPARWWLPPDPRPVDTLRRVAGWCRRGGGRLSVLWALPLCRVPLCREPSGPPLAARPAAPARRVRTRTRLPAKACCAPHQGRRQCRG
jgi:hypothetical protein